MSTIPISADRKVASDVDSASIIIPENGSRVIAPRNIDPAINRPICTHGFIAAINSQCTRPYATARKRKNNRKEIT